MFKKNHGKTSERKLAEINELQIQMGKLYLCGPCHRGFDTMEEYEEHNMCEEHNFHITRKIKSMMPGLGFCAACSAVIQTQKGWESHILTDKHVRCTQALGALGIEGQYDQPLGCDSPGTLGMPISAHEINIKLAMKHGYGHGGKMANNIPLIGLENLAQSSRFQYVCNTCMTGFPFEHRGNHLGGDEHYINYLRSSYPAWYSEVAAIPPAYVVQVRWRLLFFAHKVEQLERESEAPGAQELRHRFITEDNKFQTGHTRPERDKRACWATRGRGNSSNSYGSVVFVKEGDKTDDTSERKVGHDSENSKIKETRGNLSESSLKREGQVDFPRDPRDKGADMGREFPERARSNKSNRGRGSQAARGIYRGSYKSGHKDAIAAYYEKYGVSAKKLIFPEGEKLGQYEPEYPKEADLTSTNTTTNEGDVEAVGVELGVGAKRDFTERRKQCPESGPMRGRGGSSRGDSEARHRAGFRGTHPSRGAPMMEDQGEGCDGAYGAEGGWEEGYSHQPTIKRSRLVPEENWEGYDEEEWGGGWERNGYQDGYNQEGYHEGYQEWGEWEEEPIVLRGALPAPRASPLGFRGHMRGPMRPRGIPIRGRGIPIRGLQRGAQPSTTRPSLHHGGGPNLGALQQNGCPTRPRGVHLRGMPRGPPRAGHFPRGAPRQRFLPNNFY